MRSKLKLSRILEFISASFKEQQVINTRGGANLAPPPPVLIGLNKISSAPKWISKARKNEGNKGRKTKEPLENIVS